MQLWTHHPSSFRVDDPNLTIDWTKGKFWNSSDPNLRYREVLPILQERLREENFLWCCTSRGEFVRVSEDVDLVEWELNVPASQVLALYRENVWEELVWGRSDNWDNLLLPVGEDVGKGIGAVVRVPLEAVWVTCHGQLPTETSRIRGAY